MCSFMRKVISLCLVSAITFCFAILQIKALTIWRFEDWQSGDDYGSKSKISSNVTNLKGEKEETDGMKIGPFNKASKAKLDDGIEEEVYVGLVLDNYQSSELFELSIALNQFDVELKYLTEAVVMTQKSADKFVITANWSNKKTIATIDKDGVYTYRWEFKKENGKIKVKFTVLDYDEELGTTDFVELDVKNVDKATDVRYLWACNIKASYGVDIYTSLPPKDKEENPDTGDVNLFALIGLIAVCSLGFIYTIRRFN